MGQFVSKLHSYQLFKNEPDPLINIQLFTDFRKPIKVMVNIIVKNQVSVHEVTTYTRI